MRMHAGGDIAGDMAGYGARPPPMNNVTVVAVRKKYEEIITKIVDSFRFV